MTEIINEKAVVVYHGNCLYDARVLVRVAIDGSLSDVECPKGVNHEIVMNTEYEEDFHVIDRAHVQVLSRAISDCQVSLGAMRGALADAEARLQRRGSFQPREDWGRRLSKGLLTTEEVGRRYGVKPLAVTGWCRRGLLPGAEIVGTKNKHVWLIPEEALSGFVPPRAGRPGGLAMAWVIQLAEIEYMSDSGYAGPLANAQHYATRKAALAAKAAFMGWPMAKVIHIVL